MQAAIFSGIKRQSAVQQIPMSVMAASQPFLNAWSEKTEQLGLWAVNNNQGVFQG